MTRNFCNTTAETAILRETRRLYSVNYGTIGWKHNSVLAPSRGHIAYQAQRRAPATSASDNILCAAGSTPLRKVIVFFIILTGGVASLAIFLKETIQ